MSEEEGEDEEKEEGFARTALKDEGENIERVKPSSMDPKQSS